MIENISAQTGESWTKVLATEFEKSYFATLNLFLNSERQKYTVYPPEELVYNAFVHTPFDSVKVVILGQDPYHGCGQAHGLSFSVPYGIKPPPSLANIYKELHSDVNVAKPASGNLAQWADRGVFLLNATLTVRADSAGSHQKRGWERFTDRVIQILSRDREHLVFMLWGNYARAKKSLINAGRHLILEASHPSPLSARTGFFGCRHFSKANDYLAAHGINTIDWSIQ
jgi:uracil-DNA glycosylase